MILVSAIMMTAATYAQKNTNVTPFDKVNVNVPARVRFVYGENFSVSVRSANSYEASAVRCDVKNGTLTINNLGNTANQDELYITIVSPVEPQLHLGRNVEIK